MEKLLQLLSKAFELNQIDLKADIEQTKKTSEEFFTYQERVRKEKYESYENLITINPGMIKLFKTIKKYDELDLPLLIYGETGTGKTVLARFIHKNSLRRESIFQNVHCGRLNPNLSGSELFGHEKGAFTGAIKLHKGFFESANGGTLFLDDINTLPLDLQAGILQVIESGEFNRVGGTKTIKTDVRVIAATNEDLQEKIAKKEFREDLYHRLKRLMLRIPPLRERRDDILLLAAYFFEKLCIEHKRKYSEVSALTALREYSWPGNVRDLENVMIEIILNVPGNEIRSDHLPKEIRTHTEPGSEFVRWRNGDILRKLDAIKLELFKRGIKLLNGDKKKAANGFGISDRTIDRLRKKYRS